MRITFTHEAGPGEWFLPGSADRMVGKTVAVFGVGPGTVVAARVVEGGAAVQLEIVAGVEVMVRVGQVGT